MDKKRKTPVRRSTRSTRGVPACRLSQGLATSTRHRRFVEDSPSTVNREESQKVNFESRSTNARSNIFVSNSDVTSLSPDGALQYHCDNDILTRANGFGLGAVRKVREDNVQVTDCDKSDKQSTSVLTVAANTSKESVQALQKQIMELQSRVSDIMLSESSTYDEVTVVPSAPPINEQQTYATSFRPTRSSTALPIVNPSYVNDIQNCSKPALSTLAANDIQQYEQERRQQYDYIPMRSQREYNHVHSSRPVDLGHDSSNAYYSANSVQRNVRSQNNQEFDILNNRNRECDSDINALRNNTRSGRTYNNNNNNNHNNNHQGFQHFITRQSMSKELPKFDGNPDDWLLFYSQYCRSTELCRFSRDENLLRLHKCLHGQARETVKALLILPQNVDTIIETLKARFGRDEYVIKSLINKARRLTSPKEDQPHSIIEFATAVNNLVVTLQNLGRDEYLTNPQLLEDIEAKLPPVMMMLWSNAVMNINRYSLIDLGNWINGQAKAAGLRVMPKGFEDDKPRNKAAKQKVFAASDGSDTLTSRSCNNCLCCQQSCESLANCDKFLKSAPDDRWMIVRKYRLCFSCLKKGHSVFKCRKRKVCDAKGCQKKHHRLLHTEMKPIITTIESSVEKETCTQTTTTKKDVLLKIIPVILRVNDRVVRTGALLDSGSTVTLLRSDIAAELNASGPTQPLCIQWANGETCHERNSRVLTIGIVGCHRESRPFMLRRVKTVEKLPLHKQSVDIDGLAKEWPYLKGLPVSNYSDLQPGILLGEDNAFIMAPSKVVRHDENSPIASKTPLGWVISGNQTSKTADITTNDAFVFHTCDASLENLHQLVKSSFALDDYGVKITTQKGRSKEDDQALRLLDSSTARIADKRWEVGLLWRNSNEPLPESKHMAIMRLKCLEKKLDADLILKKAYSIKIQDYIEKGYFEKVDSEPSTLKIWYLPHFPVVNPNKPKKLRIVFDAASKSNGKSLNDFLFTGPDLLKPLPAVLFRFRERKIGFVGDIREMYHRVGIRKEDQNSQLILWRGDDRQRSPDIYKMTAMTFGASCSPSAAMYIKDRNASEHANTHPAAARMIIQNHYVDDCLGCAENVEDAVKLICDVSWIHSEGGFEIRNWTSSSSTVLAIIPEQIRAETASLEISSDSMERVLGIWWMPTADVFTYKFKHQRILEMGITPTKRQILKTLMSIYDPIGMVAHVLIRGRIIMQNVWKTGIHWDDEVTNKINLLWQSWLREMVNIERVSVPRCYSPRFSTAANVQLHVFCDASEEAYGAVAYFRIDNGEIIETAFIVAKSRVAPLKSSTIPRLELQAALIGSRLVTTIITEHDIKPSSVHMWSDSRTVLSWIRAQNRRFRQYVAQRVGEILEHTNVNDWRWVPSKENVADDATRLESSSGFEPTHRWYTGPSFLLLSESDWPIARNFELVTSDAENEVINEIYSITEPCFSILRFDKWSSPLRTIRCVAWILRFINNSRPNSIRLTTELTSDEINFAELICIRSAQKQCFADDIECIRHARSVKSSSKLRNLCAQIGKDDIIRVGSRLNQLEAEESYKNPVILDGRHHFSEALVRFYHQQCNHQNDATVLNEIRQKFWLIGAKRTLKKIKNECMACRIRKSQPEEQLMGQLPRVRLEYGVHPFTYTGVDYFGPIEVVVGRRNEKRYGVLFTCMTCRAVHLEVAASLTTDSFLMALRRFVSRRGNPKELFSDNGTNFRGANTEITKAINALDNDVILQTTSTKNIKWNFIPPLSPHFGGCWERMVRSVKSSLAVTLKTKKPTDELLHTLLLEIEHVINSRPLTDVPLSHKDEDVITPNHLLIGRSSNVAPVGKFDDKDLILRKQWRASQRLADIFWSQWIKLYLSSLTLRSKWQKAGRKLSIGDVVLIADSNEPRNSWPRGVITKVFPGEDGVVRVVNVRTSTGESKRPVHKICQLRLSTNSPEQME